MLAIEPRGVKVTWPISKKMKILDFLKFGQRCLGWFWLIERLSVLAQIDVLMALGLYIVDPSWSGTTSFDTFATDQPTDHFALTRYNDRNRSAPTVRLSHLSTFIMLSFASKLSIHIVSNVFGQNGQKWKLPIEPRGVKVTWPMSKKLKILDLMRLGQGRLGTPGMALVDWKSVCIGPCWCLEVSGTV